jgi:hypothetical protein
MNLLRRATTKKLIMRRSICALPYGAYEGTTRWSRWSFGWRRVALASPDPRDYIRFGRADRRGCIFDYCAPAAAPP